MSSSTIIGSGDTFVFLSIDTSAARTITLPSIAAVSSGRIYILKDATGQSNTNAITITPNGSDTVDTASSATIDSNFGSRQLVSDGVSNWNIS